MSEEEDRAALLAKIKADMAASRQKIDEMKERKARGTIVLDTKTPEEKKIETKKFEETSDLVKRLKEEREAKKKALQEKSVGFDKPVINIDSGEKNTLSSSGESTRIRSPSISKTDRFRPNLRKPSIDQGQRFRTASIDKGPGRFRKPSLDLGIGVRNRTISVDQGKRKPPTRMGNARLAVSKDKTSVTPEKKDSQKLKRDESPSIRSLTDMQEAISKANEAKKIAEKKREEEEKLRELRNKRKNEMTKEERRALRESKRMTVEMKENESRVKIDKQIGGFMMMMQKLEADWQKGEEARIKSAEDMAEQQKLMEKVVHQMEFLTSSMSDVSARMDHMKLMLDRLVDTAPKSVKKEEKWHEELKRFQEKFWKMRHQAYISTAKYKKMMEEQEEEKKNLENNNNSPSIPGAPPPIAPQIKSNVGTANPITNLLAQIRKGTDLKKLDPKQVEEERKQRKGNWRQSVALLQGLQDTLRDALDQRHLSLFSDEESDEDWDSEDDEEWDD